jgi:hypothetical protein
MDDQSNTVCGGPETVISRDAADADMANALDAMALTMSRSVRLERVATGTARHLRKLWEVSSILEYI